MTLKEKSAPPILPEKERTRDLIIDDVRETMRKLINGKLKWPWYLWGPPRVGKTCSALCLLDFASGWYSTADQWAADLNEARETGIKVVIPGKPIESSPGAREISRVFILRPADLWRRIKTAPLVVIDDVAYRDRASDHQGLSIKRVLDERSGSPLICIGNWAPETLADRYDKPIAARILEATVSIYPRKKGI